MTLEETLSALVMQSELMLVSRNTSAVVELMPLFLRTSNLLEIHLLTPTKIQNLSLEKIHLKMIKMMRRLHRLYHQRIKIHLLTIKMIPPQRPLTSSRIPLRRCLSSSNDNIILRLSPKT